MSEGSVVAIGTLSNLLDLQVGCFGTLSKLIKQGSKVSLVIAPKSSRKFSKKNMKLEEVIQKSAKTIGISDVYFTDRFDYSSISQDNVNVLRSLLGLSCASVAIIPFRRTNDPKQRILAESSLLACRNIRNLFMYRGTTSNSEFIPNLFSRIPKDCILLKELCIDALREDYSKDAAESINEEKLKEKESSSRANTHNFRTNTKYFESFAIHRLILLSSNEILE
jgi:hypothetical protein